MRRTDFIYLLFIFIGGCLSPVISHASTFMPIVTNYTAKGGITKLGFSPRKERRDVYWQ